MPEREKQHPVTLQEVKLKTTSACVEDFKVGWFHIETCQYRLGHRGALRKYTSTQLRETVKRKLGQR